MLSVRSSPNVPAVRPRTHVPLPCWLARTPCDRSSRYAATTVLLLTKRARASARSDGRWVPAASEPSSIAVREEVLRGSRAEDSLESLGVGRDVRPFACDLGRNL